MKRNKVLRGGPEPLIFFSLVYAPRVIQPLAHILSRLFNSSNFSFTRAISLVRFHPRVHFFLSIVNVLSILSFSLSPKTLIRGLAFFCLFSFSAWIQPFSRDFEAGRRHLTIFARQVLQGKRIER